MGCMLFTIGVFYYFLLLGLVIFRQAILGQFDSIKNLFSFENNNGQFGFPSAINVDLSAWAAWGFHQGDGMVCEYSVWHGQSEFGDISPSRWAWNLGDFMG